jgi:hypothetical protein
VRPGRQRQAGVEPFDEYGDVLVHGGQPYSRWGAGPG